MKTDFIAASGQDAANNWLICWTGQDDSGAHWNVTTNDIRASDLAAFSHGPQADAELIARLLSWYYTDTVEAEQEVTK
jgi:uncharacterized protein (DUF427 family)